MNRYLSRNLRLALLLMAMAVFTFGLSFALANLRRNSDQKVAEASLAGLPTRIAYLTSASEELGNLDRAAFVAEEATLVAEGVNLKELDAKIPLDGLIFDSSAQTRLDKEWLQKRYGQGLAVVGINVNVIELANLVGDKTSIKGPWKNAVPLPDGPYYSLLCSFVTGPNPSDVETYLTEVPNYIAEDGSVGAVPGIQSQLNVVNTISQTYLNPQSIKPLFINLQGCVDSVRAAKGNSQYPEVQKQASAYNASLSGDVAPFAYATYDPTTSQHNFRIAVNFAAYDHYTSYPNGSASTYSWWNCGKSTC